MALCCVIDNWAGGLARSGGVFSGGEGKVPPDGTRAPEGRKEWETGDRFCQHLPFDKG